MEYGERSFSYRRRDDLIESYGAMDGFYVFTTDAVELNAEETRAEYRRLQEVEQAFRTMKSTDIFMRPIRLWNTERVKAHIFICMLAYMIVWKTRKELAEFLKPENELQTSIQTAWQTLAEIQIGKIKIGERIHEQLSQPENTCKKLLRLAGMTMSKIGKRFLCV